MFFILGLIMVKLVNLIFKGNQNLFLTQFFRNFAGDE